MRKNKNDKKPAPMEDTPEKVFGEPTGDAAATASQELTAVPLDPAPTPEITEQSAEATPVSTNPLFLAWTPEVKAHMQWRNGVVHYRFADGTVKEASIGLLTKAAYVLRDAGKLAGVPTAHGTETKDNIITDEAVLTAIFAKAAELREQRELEQKDRPEPRHNKHNFRPRPAAPTAPAAPAEKTPLDRIADAHKFVSGLTKENKRQELSYQPFLTATTEAKDDAQDANILARADGKIADLSGFVERAERAAREAGALSFNSYRDRVSAKLEQSGLGLSQVALRKLIDTVGEIDADFQDGKLSSPAAKSQLFNRVEKTLGDAVQIEQRATYVPRGYHSNDRPDNRDNRRPRF